MLNWHDIYSSKPFETDVYNDWYQQKLIIPDENGGHVATYDEMISIIESLFI